MSLQCLKRLASNRLNSVCGFAVATFLHFFNKHPDSVKIQTGGFKAFKAGPVELLIINQRLYIYLCLRLFTANVFESINEDAFLGLPHLEYL